MPLKAHASSAVGAKNRSRPNITRSRTCVHILSLLAPAHFSDARGLTTRAHISPSDLRPILPGPVDPAHSAYILRAARLSSLAAHFFYHTRPPGVHQQ